MLTALDINGPVLEEVKRLQESSKPERKSLGRLVSELLTEALAHRRSEVRESAGFAWVSQPMNARVDLEDKEAVLAVLDRAE